ncbi:MAG: hypothetical protein Kow0058_08220 [Roseovarius sp.]
MLPVAAAVSGGVIHRVTWQGIRTRPVRNTVRAPVRILVDAARAARPRLRPDAVQCVQVSRRLVEKFSP